MPPLRSRPPSSDPVPLQTRALEHLSFIRDTMERAGAFTAVPGWGGVGMGITALIAAGVAHRQPSVERWLLTWVAAGWLAFAIGGLAMVRKAAGGGSSLGSRPGRRFVLALAPPLLIGGLLSVALVRAGQMALLPGTWLLLYGAGVVAGGALSIPVVPVMGACFLGLGGVALFTPGRLGDWFLAAGFGLIHVGFGVWIARRHGG